MADKGFKLWESDYEVIQEMTDLEKAEYLTIMCEFYFEGVEVNPKDIESKTVRLAWKSRKPVLEKSRRNAKDYSNRQTIQNKAPEEPLKDENKEVIIPTIKLFKNDPKTPKETISLNETMTAQDEQDNNIEIGEKIMHTEDGKIWHTDAEIRSVAAEIWTKYQMDENTDFEEFKREILPQYSQGWANIDRTRLKDFIGLGIHNCKNKEKEII